MRRKIAKAIGIALVGYVALCAAAKVGYPRLLFPAPRVDEASGKAVAAMSPGARTLELTHPSGGATRALLWPAPPGARTVVFFHGNGETIFDERFVAEELVRGGLGVMLVEYRGYGVTYGPTPTERLIIEDAEAALAELARQGVGPDRVALCGFSLGTGVAAEMARRGRAARVVLLAPYTSIVDMGRRVAPVLPVSLLMTDRFDTLAKAREIHAPTLVVHGDRDEVVPYAMGRTVAEAIPGARFVTVAGGHHMDLLAGRPEIFAQIVEHIRNP